MMCHKQGFSKTTVWERKLGSMERKKYLSTAEVPWRLSVLLLTHRQKAAAKITEPPPEVTYQRPNIWGLEHGDDH